jgi:hypothetical protein
MAVTFVGGAAIASAGVTGTASASCNPTRSASTAVGDRVFILAVASATISTPASWTLVGQASVGSGTLGAGTGPRNVALFYRDYDGSWVNPAVATVSAAQASIAAVSMTWSKDASESWDTPTLTTGSDTTSGTGFSAAGSSMAIPTNAGVMVMGAFPTDPTSIASTSLTATGVTFAALTTRNSLGGTSTGNDAYLSAYTTSVTTGATAAPTYASTLGVAMTGGALFAFQTVTPTAVPATVIGVTATASGAANAGALTAGASITGATATGSGAANAGALVAGASITGATASASGAANAGSVTAGASIAGATASASGATNAGALIAGATIGGATASASGAANAGVAQAAATITGITAVATGASPAGTVSAGATVAGQTASATGAAQAGVVIAGAVVGGITAVSFASANAGIVSAAALIEGATAVATASAHGGRTGPIPPASNLGYVTAELLDVTEGQVHLLGPVRTVAEVVSMTAEAQLQSDGEGTAILVTGGVGSATLLID